MSYDAWLTTPPDDDPEGWHQHEEQPIGMHCSDCGRPWEHGFCSVATSMKVFCRLCVIRRGFKYLFDKRSFAQIEADEQKGAA